MEFFEVVEKRYTYRGEFTDAPVPREDLIKIADAGRRAPSGANLQTQSSLIVTDAELRAKAAEIFPHKGIKTAPALMLLLSEHIERRPGVSFEVKDYGAAAENILLAVTALGYATVWTDGETSLNSERQAAFRELFNIPEQKLVMAVLPIGVPQAPGVQRERKPFEEIVQFERF